MSELMMKFKNAKNLDPRQSALVDGAYFCCKPPEGAFQRRKQRHPIQEYIRYLIFELLSKKTIALVLKKLLKLPWEQYERYVLKKLLKVRSMGVRIERRKSIANDRSLE